MTLDTRSLRERMLAGDLYIADDPELAELATVSDDLQDAYNATASRQGRANVVAVGNPARVVREI